MPLDFPTAPPAYGLNGPSAAVTVEKSLHASHTEILTTPALVFYSTTIRFISTQRREASMSRQ